jgi:ribosomal-protein-alanine N-acetyltransferase
MLDLSLIIRDARLEDLDTIFRIEKASFIDPYPKSLLKSFFYFPGIYIVASLKDIIIGYAIGIIRYEKLGHVISVAVIECARRQGVGQRLMTEIIERFCSIGIKRVRIEVRESNLPAIKLYTKLGFIEKGKIKKYYGDGEAAILMYLNGK